MRNTEKSGATMPVCTEIRLKKLLPAVFAGEREKHLESEIWLRDVSLCRGSRYMIEAESGSGKSSLCSFIYGLRNDFEGSIEFLNGSEPLGVSDTVMRQRVLAYLPQELKLFPALTAIENIELKNSLTGYKTCAEISEMLAFLGIKEYAHRPVGRLSIGQQQRVAIVRALCQPYSFLLLDEPVSHLDAASNHAVAELIARETDANGAGVLITSVGNKLLLDNCRTLRL